MSYFVNKFFKFKNEMSDKQLTRANKTDAGSDICSSVDFTIPANAMPGFYDLHVITWSAFGTPWQSPFDNVLTGGFLVTGGAGTIEGVAPGQPVTRVFRKIADRRSAARERRKDRSPVRERFISGKCQCSAHGHSCEINRLETA